MLKMPLGRTLALALAHARLFAAEELLSNSMNFESGEIVAHDDVKETIVKLRDWKQRLVAALQHET
jgi:hypothetical protein